MYAKNKCPYCGKDESGMTLTERWFHEGICKDRKYGPD